MKRTIARFVRAGAKAPQLFLTGIAGLALFSLWAASEERPPEYRVIALDTMGGRPDAEVFAVNAAGEATGEAFNAANQDHAYLFRRGVMNDLGTLAESDNASNSIGRAINDAGQIAGSSTVSETTPKGKQPFHAFLYSNGHLTDLGTLGGFYSDAFAINSRGEVTGNASLPGTLVEHAYLYKSGHMNDLGTLGGNFSIGSGINSRGAVVGSSSLPGEAVDHAFIYIDGLMQDLGALADPGSEALAINCAGEVTGLSAVPNGDFHAFVYAHGHMKDLGVFPGDIYSVGYGINSEGVIVGASGVHIAENDHAFVYIDGKMFDLMTLIDRSDPLLPLNLIEARAISDSGVIAVNGRDSLGDLRAYLLEPLHRHGEEESSGRDRSSAHECSGADADKHGDKNEEHRDKKRGIEDRD